MGLIVRVPMFVLDKMTLMLQNFEKWFMWDNFVAQKVI